TTPPTAPTRVIAPITAFQLAGTARSMRYGLTKTHTRRSRPSGVILPSIPIASAQLRSTRQVEGFVRSRWLLWTSFLKMLTRTNGASRQQLNGRYRQGLLGRIRPARNAALRYGELCPAMAKSNRPIWDGEERLGCLSQKNRMRNKA